MIEPKADIHIELATTQKKIEEHLGLGSDRLIFEFSLQDGSTRLDLITVNPKHRQSFLFQTVKGYDRLDAVSKMFKYVVQYRDKENHYTIQWMANGDNELHTSYFRASNVYDALDKLYFGRDVNTITVFSVALNPMT